MTLTSSTVSGNSTAGAEAAGGGIFSFGNAMTFINSTVTDNHADHATATGGGIWIGSDGSIAISGSIVAGNTAGGGMIDINPGTGSLQTNFSLIEQTGLTITGSDNIIGQSANLGPLADNGGPTQTHALLPGSPAIDAGDPAAMAGVGNVPLFDQRGVGFDRVLNGRIDIGAFEVQVVPSDSADFDSDDDVDGRDFLLWQRGFGKPNASKADGDADNDMDVDGNDLSVWQGQYGTGGLLAVNNQPFVREEDSSSEYRRGGLDSAEFVDLALTKEWMDRAIVEQKAFTLVEDTEDEAARDAVFASGDEFLAAKPQAAIVVEEVDENGDDESWLSEELLERVFG